MKTHLLISLLFTSGSLFAASQGLQIGGGSNSGYENLTCKQMVVENLSYQAHSNLNENTLKEFKDRCMKIGSKALGGLLTFGQAEREQCFKELWDREKQYENKMNAFVNALGIRVQIYDSLSIKDKSKLSPECMNVTAKSYVRPAAMSDQEFFQKLYLKCKIKTEVEMGPPSQTKALYGSNSAAYEDRETCQSYLYEYSKLKYGETFSAPPIDAPKPAAQQECRTLKCADLLASPTNNPSPCYRNALVNCMTSDHSTANGSGGSISTGN